MINLILHYLLALPEGESLDSSSAEPSVSAARKRKSMDLATMMATKVEPEYTPLLFNLVDLIQSCLKSPNQQTVCVTLQLLAAILKRHHRYAIITLLNTEGVSSTSYRTIGAHQQEVEFLMTLAESAGGKDNFDGVYDSILKDTMTRVEGHPCSIKLVTPKVSTNNHKLPAIPDSLPGAPRDVPPHTLNPQDPLLNNILDLLETFFVNSVETNLSVTETILDMAVCGYISIEGWLLRHPTKYQFEEDHDELVRSSEDATAPTSSDTEKLEAVGRFRRRPKWQPSTLPRILSILESLADQISSFRSSVPRFEELLQQRREAFQTADAMIPPQFTQAGSKAPNPPPEQTNFDESRSASPVRPSVLEGFAQRILSELGSPGHSTSPQIRQEPSHSSRTFSTPSKPLPPKPLPSPPKEFPLNLENPSQSGIAQPIPVRDQRDESLLGERVSPPKTQPVVFTADQEILSRRVGLPVQKVAPIPLDFNKGSSKNVVEDTDVAENTDDVGEKEEGKDTEDDKQPTEEEGEAAEPSEADAPLIREEATASVSHILTNTIILQAFLLEVASLVQVRAGLFNEVRFA